MRNRQATPVEDKAFSLDWMFVKNRQKDGGNPGSFRAVNGALRTVHVILWWCAGGGEVTRTQLQTQTMAVAPKELSSSSLAEELQQDNLRRATFRDEKVVGGGGGVEPRQEKLHVDTVNNE